MRKLKYITLLLLIGCGQEKLFRTVQGNELGIDFENTLTETEDFNILDYLYFYNGGGVAVGDINGDDLPDIFLSGNQVRNRLYLNKGDLRFEDITDNAGVGGSSEWNTGAVMGDVNGDGLLDIYVCAVVGLKGLSGRNELYINQGNAVFKEEAAKYRLDFDTYSSSAAFLDYDMDGDLDLFLLNHAIHTQKSFGHAKLRLKRVYETGDRLLRNNGGKFEDVSEAAGIYGGVNSYGLGVAVADFNQDGYPDVYVGNDFHEDDYYYLNNGDGSFSDKLKQYFSYTTRFSMGSDVADINHDGLPDLISLDMLPEDEEILKTSEGDDDVNILRLRTKNYGYHYQFSRNMLQLNTGTGPFREVANVAGVAATDWSWSALFADFNQDAELDIFISNGIPRRPNDLDYIRFVSSDQIKNRIATTKLVDQRALAKMPSGAVPNYMFEGSWGYRFTDKSDEWIDAVPGFSTAAAVGDLDNDGDMDIITNNVGASPTIYINQAKRTGNYLKLRLKFTAPNPFAIGTKVYAYHGGTLQYKELYTVRGFQSSSEPVLHFGMGTAAQMDSIRLIWPNGESQVLKNLPANREHAVLYRQGNAVPHRQPEKTETPLMPLFDLVQDHLGIDFTHREDRYIDFDRQKLMPYQVSDRGPAFAAGDLNGDGLEDLFFGGSKYRPSTVFFREADGSFTENALPEVQKDSIKEETAAVVGDFDGNGLNDIITGSGGADFFKQADPLTDNYYLQTKEGFAEHPFPESFENASVVAAHDFDGDGDLDVFVGNQAVSNDFGNTPTSFLYANDRGRFRIIKNNALQKVGMVTDAIWSDYDGDGAKDLIVVGEWMSPVFFRNDGGTLVEDKSALTRKLNGLWQCIAAFDIDRDGDEDYVLGNWGLNTRFSASERFPMRMYYGDFDENGSTETVTATAKHGKYYPIETFDQLAGQIVSLRKKYTSYAAFAGQTIDRIFSVQQLRDAEILSVEVLESGFLRNEGDGTFTWVPFDADLQAAPIMASVVFDFDHDGHDEALLAGNYFGVKPFQGRPSSFSGALVQDEDDIVLGHKLGLELMNKSARHLKAISIGEEDYLLAVFNNDKTQLYRLLKK